MQKGFHASSTSGAPVADTVRQIEIAVARYLRLVSTLVSDDTVGLGVSDSDQLTLLVVRCLRRQSSTCCIMRLGNATLRIIRPPFVGNTSKELLLSFKGLSNFSVLGRLGMKRLRNPRMGI